ncbi:MAG: hypothetical protein AMJ53_12440 [Gammaproteobacteria bacterium SG8_11]|nr:MAG: hypothetical protein AMJ53_12440 [Gammaproteobacteria bacterium SG8_11]
MSGRRSKHWEITMDNRWSNRKDLDISVDIYQHGDKLATGRSRDVGLGGAYLDSVQVNHNLSIDNQVELVFHLVEGSSEVKYSLHARVVRVDNDGIGLKFHDFDTGVFRSLQQIMAYKEVEAIH